MTSKFDKAYLYKDYFNNWEEVPDEDLWEDGEISNNTCMIKIYNNVVVDGKWKVIRKTTKGERR